MPEGKDCAVHVTVGIIGGRWKVLLLQALFKGTRRNSELRRELGRVTPKVLAQQLRELERDGIVTRHVHAEVPPRVEYSLTPLGQSLWPILQAMHAWGAKHPHAAP
jgi:DNA-binding HxlR family transcriptional regulator